MPRQVMVTENLIERITKDIFSFLNFFALAVKKKTTPNTINLDLCLNSQDTEGDSESSKYTKVYL